MPASSGWLTCLMFFTFAMTTDAVGSVIPRLIQEHGLSMTAAGAFQYATMAGIATGALLLGFLADRIGRKRTIILGLALLRPRFAAGGDERALRDARGAAGGFGSGHQRVQDRRAGTDRRHHALQYRAHATHEQRRGLLRRRRHRRSRHRGHPAGARHVVEVALPVRGDHLRRPRDHGGARALSGHAPRHAETGPAADAARDAGSVPPSASRCWSCCMSPSKSRSTCGCPPSCSRMPAPGAGWPPPR